MCKIDKELIDPVTEPATEKAHRSARALLAGIPFYGGALVESFSAIIEPPMARRKKEWMIQVTDAINKIYANNLASEESLRNNEKFITTLIHASSAALRNHQVEKLEALKNAVYNSVATNIDENKALLFTRIIDEITPVHFLVLRFLNNPEMYEKQLRKKDGPNTFTHYSGNLDLWEGVHPDLKKDQSFIDHIVKELHLLSFINQQSLQGSIGRVTTNYGREFINFIG